MNFQIRPFSSITDIPALLRLRLEAEAVDQEGNQVDEQALIAQLRLPGHDPNHDRWVIVSPQDPNALIGSCLVWLPPDTDLVKMNLLVHPAWRQQGLGSLLFARALERARDLRGKNLQAFGSTRNAGVEAFMLKHDFSKEGAYRLMRQPMPERLPTPVLPYGYRLSTYAEVQDLSTLTYAMNVCYQGLWGHQEVSETQMASWLPEFNQQALFLVYSPSGKVVGISRVDIDADRCTQNGIPTGYIDAPGFHHHHRRMDLYRALLMTGLRWLQAQDIQLIEMESWGDKLEIINLYRSLGFEINRELVSYTRPL
jgi:mycothiol synthase